MASVDPARRGAGAFYVASGAGRNNVAAPGLTLLRGCGAPHSNPGLDVLTLIQRGRRTLEEGGADDSDWPGLGSSQGARGGSVADPLHPAVMAAMIGILSLSQGEDAIYGAVIAGDRRWLVFATVTAWAVQNWYWARFLLSLPLRGFPARLYGGRPFDAAFADPLTEWIPRVLGALAFVIVGGFAYAASCPSVCPGEPPGSALLWMGWYFLSAVLFLVATTLRRILLRRSGAAAMPVLPPVPAGLSHIAAFVALGWLALLVLAAASAVIDFRGLGSAEIRQVAALAIVATLTIGSFVVLL